jgi:hypothetical protein
MTYDEALALIEPNIDDYGLIVHNLEQWGGGDTAQREGMWSYGMALAFPEKCAEIRERFERSLQLLERSPGNYSRHTLVPGAPDWYADASDFTRDQSIPLVAAMGRLKMRDRLKAFFDANLKRGMIAQNGRDPWWWPYYLAFWVRALAESKSQTWQPYLSPLLWLGDISLIFASVVKCIQASLDEEHSDDLNFQIILIQSNSVTDTPYAKFARWIYSNFRPALKGTLETWGPASALEHYFFTSSTAKESGAPRVDRLYNQNAILKIHFASTKDTANENW